MARINFRVTENNDFSRTGPNTRAVVAVCDGDNADGTGLDREHLGPFQKGTVIDGRLELSVGSDIQSKFLAIGTLLPVDFPTLVIGGQGTTPEEARALAKAEDTSKKGKKGEKKQRSAGKAKGARKKR